MTDQLKKIRVVHVIGSTGLYGAERWILALMRGTNPDLVDSTLVNLVDTPGEVSKVVIAAQQRGLAAQDFYTGGKFNVLGVWRFSRWLKQQQIDVVHGHGFKSDLLGLIAARLAGCRMITTPHGWSLEADKKLRLYEDIDRFSFRFMDMVCPLSPDLAEGLTSFVEMHKLRMIFNGVDIDEIETQEPYERDHGGFYDIGYIGQLIERKDMPTLLQAFAQVVTSRPQTRLFILGDGSKRLELEAMTKQLNLENSISFMGFIPDAAAWLKTFDLFVLPSRLEGIPRCIMEALAASVPVIVSDIPGNRELVADNVTGLLFPLSDHLMLAQRIVYMMDNPEKAQAMAAQGKKLVDEKYSNRNMAREYTKIYKTLTAD